MPSDDAGDPDPCSRGVQPSGPSRQRRALGSFIGFSLATRTDVVSRINGKHRAVVDQTGFALLAELTGERLESAT